MRVPNWVFAMFIGYFWLSTMLDILDHALQGSAAWIIYFLLYMVTTLLALAITRMFDLPISVRAGIVFLFATASEGIARDLVTF